MVRINRGNARWLVGLAFGAGLGGAALAQEPAQPATAQAPRVIAAGQGIPALCLADLEQMALQGNPTLAQASAQVEASRGKALQAGLAPNPTAGYQAEQIGVQGT